VFTESKAARIGLGDAWARSDVFDMDFVSLQLIR